MTGIVVQVNVSNGGVPKHAVDRAHVTVNGIAGDAHRDREHHGGPDRAVCLYAVEAIQALAVEGHAVRAGTLGENVTVEGLDWAAIAPGARLQLADEVLLEITRYTTPCVNIRAAFVGGDVARVSQKRHPGSSRVYARVLREGIIRTGDPVQLVT